MGACGSSNSGHDKATFLALTPFAIFFSELELEHFATFFTIKVYPMNRRLFSEGDVGKEFMIIASGAVNFTVADRDTKKESVLCTKHPGDFLGEAVLTGKVTRSASATTSEASTLLTLTKKGLNAFLRHKKTPEGTRSRMNDFVSGMGHKMKDTLGSIDFLQGIQDVELDHLSNMFSYRAVRANEDILVQGDLGNAMYVVVQGSVQVFLTGLTGKETLLTDKSLGAGSYFGEIALRMNLPRTATVRASGKGGFPALLMVLLKEDFQTLLAVCRPEAKAVFEAAVKMRVSSTIASWNIPFLQTMTGRLPEFADMVTIETIEPGEVLFRAGDVGNKFYMTFYGRLKVMNDQGAVIDTCTEGQYFGEIALVTETATRTATIAAVSRCVLMSLTREQFVGFFADTPEMLAEFELKIARYDAQLGTILNLKRARTLFEAHVASEYSSENLKCYDEMMRWIADFPHRKPEKRLAAAQRLAKQYVSAGASEQVNVNAKTRLECLAELDTGTVTIDVFTEIHLELFNLMTRDSFARFKLTPTFAGLLDQVGSYTTDELDEEEIKKLYVRTPRKMSMDTRRIMLNAAGALGNTKEEKFILEGLRV